MTEKEKKNIFQKIFSDLPLDYKLGYQDGFNGCLKVLRDTLDVISKLDVENVKKVQDKEKSK